MRGSRRALRSLRLGGALLPLLAGNAAAVEIDAAQIQALIDRVEQQDQVISELKKEVADLRLMTPPPPEHPEYRREDGEEPLTEYVNPRIRLDVAGQVNPAVNIAGDGENTKVYFVDNDVTASRIRFAGVSLFEQGPQVGTTLEVGFSPNNSFEVSQDDETPGDFISVRRAEFWAMDERLGRVMLGRGSAAADNTAEFNLSLISGMIQTSGVSFVAGGLQFTDGTSLTGVTIADAFENFDGNRQNRIRYDTPMVGPVQLSGSVGADQRYDLAITVGGDYDHWTGWNVGDFTMLGAASIRDPNQSGVDFTMAGSWSTLHRPTGLSFTAASGWQNSSDDPYSVYAQVGWDAELVALGPTGFGVDYSWDHSTSANHDRGQSVGLAAVQVIDRYGIELYSQFRWYGLDREVGPSFDDIFLGTVGTRVRF